MRQKVGIAIALAKNAKALLLDEPTSGLDPSAANEFGRLLEQASARGVAVLTTTHDLFHAKQTGTRIGIMKKGHLVESLSSEDISHRDLEALYLRHLRACGRSFFLPRGIFARDRPNLVEGRRGEVEV